MTGKTMLINAVKDACRVFAWLVVGGVTILATQGGMGVAAASLPARASAAHTARHAAGHGRTVVVRVPAVAVQAPATSNPGYRVVTTTCPAIGSVVRTYQYGSDVYALQEASMLQTYWTAWANRHVGVFSTVALWAGPTFISAGAGDCGGPAASR